MHKPIIGIVGGIGSGKSFVAQRFAELGCVVIDSDQQVREAYERPEVLAALRQWWGAEVFNSDGRVNRAAVAGRVFANPAERRRLEQLLHPLVAEARDRRMAERAGDAQVVAFVWDTPLLFEAGLAGRCDAVVFVDAPAEVRAARVMGKRQWARADWERRENSQMPLDRKREMSHHVIDNTADAEYVRDQVRRVLSLILARACGSRRPSETS